MDPITVVGFVAAVVQLIDVTSKVVSYVNNVKDAPKDRAKLAREATGLLALFTDLRYQVEETTSTDRWYTGLRSLGGEGGPLMEFKNAMERIADKLTPATTGVNLRRVLCWTLDKKDIDAILSKIERLKTLIGLALQKDHFKLSLALKEEITVGFQDIKASRDVENIKKWLSAPLASSNHNTAMKKRQPSTGEWFIQSREFAEWKVGTISFIWLHGIPGCGKTILCSTIIQDMISQYQSKPKVAVAYFYFDFNDLDKQRTEKLIGSLIIQFAAQCPYLPDSLQSAYSQSQSGQKHPTIEDMTTILHQMLKIFNAAYILLDALDECTDREDLLEFIEALVGWNMKSLHILTTSRKENDIAKSLEPLRACQLCIQSALVDPDIRVHVLERLSNDSELKKWPADVQTEIEDTLMQGAKGMFRWVVCQLDSLRKCLKLKSLRKALSTLPKTLDDTYERILSNLDEEYEEDALKILQLLCFSVHPMRLDEMAEVLAVDSTSDSLFRPEERFPDQRDILTICSTLVSVTINNTSKLSTGAPRLRLAHFSVKEYLISDRLMKASIRRYHITPTSANFAIAKSCLIYLLYFESPTILTAGFDHEFPFSRYAAQFWPEHYKYITDDADREAIDLLVCSLVESKKSCFINWLRIFNPVATPFRRSNLSLEMNSIPSPLYYLSHLGITGVVQLLLSRGANINAESTTYGNALHAASYKGHEGVVRLLLEQGANVNAEGGYYGYALLEASYNGHEGVVRLLLEKGANINGKGKILGHPLSAASYTGHEKVVRLLLEQGANVNAEGGLYGYALLGALYEGYERVTRLLLEKGANVNAEYGDHGNALSTASYLHRKNEVRLLLGMGANVNAESGIFGNALSAASRSGSEDVVRLLLEKGANVDAEGGIYGNALSAASRSGSEDVVRLLLEKRANVDAEGGKYGRALSAASRGGHQEVVRLLLEKRAKVNAQGGKYGCALSAASYFGHEGVVRLLLEEGANVNLEGGSFGNALLAASSKGHKEIVQLLLEKGANVNTECRDYGNVLSVASHYGYKGVVRLLLKSGANVNAQSGRALREASFEGHLEVMQVLLENQADFNLVLHNGDNALQELPVDNHEAVINLLLKGLGSPRVKRIFIS